MEKPCCVLAHITATWLWSVLVQVRLLMGLEHIKVSVLLRQHCFLQDNGHNYRVMVLKHGTEAFCFGMWKRLSLGCGKHNVNETCCWEGLHLEMWRTRRPTDSSVLFFWINALKGIHYLHLIAPFSVIKPCGHFSDVLVIHVLQNNLILKCCIDFIILCLFPF